MTDNKLKVLVVEDEQLLLEAIVKKLELSGIVALPFSSGKQAVRYLHEHPLDLPNVIWLDYYLKDMDGLEFMGAIKGDEQLNKVPVVVVSNSASSERVSRMLALGAKQYLLKAEYRLDEIIYIIKGQLASGTL